MLWKTAGMAFIYLLSCSQLLANTHKFLLVLIRHWTCLFLYLFCWFLVFFFPSAFLPFVFQYFFSRCQHLLFFLQCPVLPSYSLSSIAFPLEGLFRTSDIITSGFTYMSNVKYFDNSWKMSPFGHFSSVRDVFRDSIVLKVCSQLFYVSFLPDLVEVGQLVQCLMGKNWQPDIKNPFPLEIVYYLFVFLLFQP